MDKKAFSECIKRNREKKGITIDKLSEITGLSGTKLQEFETGEFERIKFSELEKIAKAIGIPMVVLMKGGGLVHRHNRDGQGKTYCEWIVN